VAQVQTASVAQNSSLVKEARISTPEYTTLPATFVWSNDPLTSTSSLSVLS
jgi:hypothetical protein